MQSYTIGDWIFEKLCAAMLLRFQWQIEKLVILVGFRLRSSIFLKVAGVVNSKLVFMD